MLKKLRDYLIGRNLDLKQHGFFINLAAMPASFGKRSGGRGVIKNRSLPLSTALGMETTGLRPTH